FVSSRRLHTIFSRDWSSDVCSSDLASIERWPLPRTAPPRFAVAFSGGLDSTVLLAAALRLELGAVRALHVNHGLAEAADAWETRSEERRVGEGCRSRGHRGV